MDASAAGSLTWYVARGSGMAAYLLLTATVVLGILLSRRAFGQRVPGLLLDGAHRWLTLSFYLFVVVHAVALLLDSFTRFSLRDLVVPFASDYRPLWMSLGIIAAELGLALGASVLVRRWIGYRTWHALHGLTYLLFPLALLHGLGTGSDTRTFWATAIYVESVILVVGAIAWRAQRFSRWGRPAVAAASLAAVGILIWAIGGPYASGWAAAAGTPRRLLGSGSTAQPVQAARAPAPPALPASLQDRISGQALLSQDRREILLRGTGSGTMPLEVAIALTRRRGAGEIQLRTSDHVPLCAGPIEARDGETLVATCTGYGRTRQFVVALDRLDSQGFSGVLQTGSGVVSGSSVNAGTVDRHDNHEDDDEGDHVD